MAPNTVTEQEGAAFADDGFFLRRGAIPEATLQDVPHPRHRSLKSRSKRW